MQAYFKVTPPSVHSMVLGLEARRLIARVPGRARSIKVLLPPNNYPQLKRDPLGCYTDLVQIRTAEPESLAISADTSEARDVAGGGAALLYSRHEETSA